MQRYTHKGDTQRIHTHTQNTHFIDLLLTDYKTFSSNNARYLVM